MGKMNEDQVEARPVGQGKDPLAGGNTLVNPSNSDTETHYAVKERSADVQKASEDTVNEPSAELATPAAEVPNSNTAEQDAVAEGRTE